MTGIDVVDQQHHVLVDLINEFGNTLTQPIAATADRIEHLFKELSKYALRHFTDEEELMRSAGLDASYVYHHAQFHHQFLSDLSALHESVAGDDTESMHSLLRFLTDWLAFHILGTDMLMVKLMAAKKQGLSQEIALEEYKKNRDPATAKLLESMDGLFRQLTERNKALSELNQSLESRVAERTKELSDANNKLEELAMTDTLTGLPNRRHAIQLVETEWIRSVRHGTDLTFMMIDVDGFKAVNDLHGHDAGDFVLAELTRHLSLAVRAYDTVCRLGGDEFLIVCVETSLDMAMQVAERVRHEVASMVCNFPDGGKWVGSVSIGVATRTSSVANASALLRAADQSAYLAKRNGRNRVESVTLIE